jgi:glycosyltransferase involved in cell wall biosynthesis
MRDMMAPPVTVLITCYNLERYIGATIESVIGQEFGGELEIIVVDDCSTDRSADIIRSYPQVRYIRTARQGGVLLAMLEGIDAASNDIVCLLDGDDLWRSDKVRRVAECFGSDERMVLVTHDLDFIDGEGRPVPQPSRPEAVLTQASPEERGDLIKSGVLQHEDFVWLGSALSFRRGLGRVGEFSQFARSLPDPGNTYQDWPLAFWLASLSDVSCGYVPEKLFSYRVHGVNHSGDASDPAKAVRNFQRTQNTVEAMRMIAVERGLGEKIVAGLEARARFCGHVVKVYSGRSAAAVTSWLQNFPYMRRKGIASKELVRCLAVQLLGAGAFARLSSSRRILRRLPPS